MESRRSFVVSPSAQRIQERRGRKERSTLSIATTSEQGIGCHDQMAENEQTHLKMESTTLFVVIPEHAAYGTKMMLVHQQCAKTN